MRTIDRPSLGAMGEYVDLLRALDIKEVNISGVDLAIRRLFSSEAESLRIEDLKSR